jgi:hypothetical protein
MLGRRRPVQGAKDRRDRVQRLLLGERPQLRPRPAALDQQGAAGRVAREQANRATPVPELEGVGLVLRLGLSERVELEDGFAAVRQRGLDDVGVLRVRERLAELERPQLGAFERELRRGQRLLRPA